MKRRPVYSSTRPDRHGSPAAAMQEGPRLDSVQAPSKGPPQGAAANVPAGARYGREQDSARAGARAEIAARRRPTTEFFMRLGLAVADRFWLRAGLAGLGCALISWSVVSFHARWHPQSKPMTAEAFDQAVRRALESGPPLPSKVTAAAASIQASIVRIEGLSDEAEEGEGDKQQSVGSGVVVIENGTILTNMHVVAGAKRLRVTFAEGLQSDAVIVGMQPDKDLAVIRAKTIPDDLAAAPLGSSANLAPGDEVAAVGFPFGIGPSVSAGVVSGLNREFRSPEGRRVLTGLIQFDAAANPGNSGGPLITMSGEVVGIVTAILNPGRERTFIGIGFATTIESAGGAVGIPPF